jgi:hypothetical protein
MSTCSTAIFSPDAAKMAASSLADDAVRAVAVTCQPRRANSRASPSPRPREAPIMIAVFRSRFGAFVTMASPDCFLEDRRHEGRGT